MAFYHNLYPLSWGNRQVIIKTTACCLSVEPRILSNRKQANIPSVSQLVVSVELCRKTGVQVCFCFFNLPP